VYELYQALATLAQKIEDVAKGTNDEPATPALRRLKAQPA
jgi:hypothetical protein